MEPLARAVRKSAGLRVEFRERVYVAVTPEEKVAILKRHLGG